MAVQYREELAKEYAGVTLETLEETPEKSLKFLRATANNRVIRRILQGRGFTPLVQELWWAELKDAAGMSRPDVKEAVIDPQVDQAVEDVDPHDEPIVEITDASLAPEFPEQNRFLLENIQPGGGMRAVLNVSLYLERREALKQGTGRELTRDNDLAAVALLEERGITEKLCQYLAERVAVARSAEEVEPVNEHVLRAADEAYVKALATLRKRYELWSRIARVTIKRRDYLIQLGLAHRKSPTRPTKDDGAGDDGWE